MRWIQVVRDKERIMQSLTLASSPMEVALTFLEVLVDIRDAVRSSNYDANMRARRGA